MQTGSDHMAVQITPQTGWLLANWTFDAPVIHQRTTSFLLLAYGQQPHNGIHDWLFNVTLQVGLLMTMTKRNLIHFSLNLIHFSLITKFKFKWNFEWKMVQRVVIAAWQPDEHLLLLLLVQPSARWSQLVLHPRRAPAIAQARQIRPSDTPESTERRLAMGDHTERLGQRACRTHVLSHIIYELGETWAGCELTIFMHVRSCCVSAFWSIRLHLHVALTCWVYYTRHGW